MKILILSLILWFVTSTAWAQNIFEVPQISNEQTTEVLYNHTLAYFATGITMAKAKGISPKEYGEYIGEQFKLFWNPESGFSFFVNQIMFILAGVNPYSQMKILEQEKNMVRLSLTNMDMLFKQGPAYGISYEEFLECSEGILSTIANHMKANFSHKTTDSGTYEITISAQ